MGLWRHLLVFAALVVNLWVGGDIIDAVAGVVARTAFELALITGYLVFVIGLGGLLREKPDDAERGDNAR